MWTDGHCGYKSMRPSYVTTSAGGLWAVLQSATVEEFLYDIIASRRRDRIANAFLSQNVSKRLDANAQEVGMPVSESRVRFFLVSGGVQIVRFDKRMERAVAAFFRDRPRISTTRRRRDSQRFAGPCRWRRRWQRLTPARILQALSYNAFPYTGAAQ